MREIKFRGKSICEDVITTRDSRIAKGDWVYGSLIADTQPYIVGEIADVDFEFIAPEFWIPVDKNTIGQFTGLYDKNGKEIYEGDVVKVYYYDGRSQDQCGGVKGIDTVVFSDGGFNLKNGTIKSPIGYDILTCCKFIEVISNIHEVKE